MLGVNVVFHCNEYLSGDIKMDNGEDKFVGDFFKAMFILLILFIGVAGVAMSIEDIFSDEPSSWNISENVTGKQISYDSKLQRNHYFIFTDNYCFDVGLSAYNHLNKGDNLNLTKYRHGNVVTLKYGDYRYDNE